jgi:hypothetical protein
MPSQLHLQPAQPATRLPPRLQRPRQRPPGPASAAQIALARPQWQLVFAGSEWDAGCAHELAALKALPNVHFLGLLPVEHVPQFIVSCDVCLIPYRVNDETRAISSLKLYEYLAAGRPVVSARVPAAEEHAAVVRMADGDGGFVGGADRSRAGRTGRPGADGGAASDGGAEYVG